MQFFPLTKVEQLEKATETIEKKFGERGIRKGKYP